MTITRSEALDLLWERPIEVGHWVGFNDLTDLHNEWLRTFLYSDHDITLQGHRGSYKTTTLALFLALHILTAPEERTMFFRKSGGDVAEVLQTTSNILQSGCMQVLSNALYGKDLILVKNSNVQIHTNLARGYGGTAQINGLGTFSAVTGKHAEIVVTDDIVNVNDRFSKSERDRTKRFYQELQNIKNRGGRILNTGTPWHKDDCFTLMPEPLKYDCYTTGLISDEELKSIKSKMTPSLFAANYELKHIASEDIIFKDPNLGADPSLAEQGWAQLDAAFYGEDYTALTIIGIHDGKFYVFGKAWRKHVDEVMEEIAAWYNQFKCTKLYCEMNADKGYVAGKLREMGLRVSTYHESQNKYIKIVSQIKFEWENIYFTRGTDEKYLEMILEYNEQAARDDAPDSLASLLRIVRKRKNDAKEDPSRYLLY